jgi:hypothetical protein
VSLTFLYDWLESVRKRFGAGTKIVEVLGEKSILAA